MAAAAADDFDIPDLGQVELEDTGDEQVLVAVLADERVHLPRREAPWTLHFTDTHEGFIACGDEEAWCAGRFQYRLKQRGGVLLKCRRDGEVVAELHPAVLGLAYKYIDIPGTVHNGRVGSIKLCRTDRMALGCQVT